MIEPANGWLLCSEVTRYTAHDLRFIDRETNAPCRHRAKFRVDGRWFCTIHDPLRPRCRSAVAHRIREPRTSELLALGLDVIGSPIDPETPRAIGTFMVRGNALHLCADCAMRFRAPAAADFIPPAAVRPPCNLCGGKTVLYDDDERPFACPCTPVGRELINGVPDEIVLRRLAAE